MNIENIHQALSLVDLIIEEASNNYNGNNNRRPKILNPKKIYVNFYMG